MTASPSSPERIDEALRVLAGDLERYPPDRFPVQHATARFHLGSVLAGVGRLEEAEEALEASVGLFDPDGLPIEHGKALNALGAVLRDRGRIVRAQGCFEEAASLFEAEGANRELGAALYNLGLIRRARDDASGAIACFRRARDLFSDVGATGHVASAGRELGGVLLATGRLEEAAETLEESARLAEAAGDREGLGEARNVLGLVGLARGRPEDAVAAFKAAAGAHPRGLRPGGYAMAKANLATAFERTGDPARARLAAMQALGVSDPPAPVVDQAEGVLDRVRRDPGALVACLGDEPEASRPALVREELSRWADARPAEQLAESRAWIAGLLASDAAGDLAELWLGGLLELPPEHMRALIRAALRASAELDDETARRLRNHVVAAMGEFHVPQWMRMKDTFTELAVDEGVDGWN